jgi:spore maturation protein CgeB
LKNLRIAVLRQTGDRGEGMTRAFQQLGHDAQSVMVDETIEPKPEPLLKFLKEFKPDFCFTENFHAFDICRSNLSLPLEEYLQKNKIPSAIWYVDSPHSVGSTLNRNRWLKGYKPDGMTFFCADRKDSNDFKKMGLSTAHLGLGIDGALEKFEFRADVLKKFEADLSYVGSSFASPSEPIKDLEDLRTFFSKSYLMLLINNIRFAQEQFYAFQPARFEQLAKNLFALIFDFFGKIYTDPLTYQQNALQLETRILEFLPTGLASMYRIFDKGLNANYSQFQIAAYLNEFAPLGLKIYGGDSWKNLLYAYQNTTPFLNDDEVLHVFRASKINFILTKWYFWGTVQEQVFLALACGGLPLTDKREELSEFFDQGEVLSYSHFEEAEDLIKHYTKDDAARQKIIHRGRARVFREHTYFHRMKTLTETMTKNWGIQA